MAFTVVFEGSPKKIEGNPFDVQSGFGKAQTIAVGDVCVISDILRDALEQIADGEWNPAEIAQAALDAENAAIRGSIDAGRAVVLEVEAQP